MNKPQKAFSLSLIYKRPFNLTSNPHTHTHTHTHKKNSKFIRGKLCSQTLKREEEIKSVQRPSKELPTHRFIQD